MSLKPTAKPSRHRALQIDILNHYPSQPWVPMEQDNPTGMRKPFRTTGLPEWQLQIIQAFPKLYLSSEDMGVANYCHLAWGLDCGQEWSPAIFELSESGSRLLDELHRSGNQPEARIEVVRVRENKGQLRIGISDNLHSPHREFWRELVKMLEKAVVHPDALGD